MAGYSVSAVNSAFNTLNSSTTNNTNATSNTSNTANHTTSRASTAANDALGKDSFLQLLVAQITNLDPTQDQNSTEYVTQLAQFSSMEQLYNLNQTMTTLAYHSLIGKGATVEDRDKTQHTGIIRGISVDGKGKYSLALEVNETGQNEIKIYSADRLVSVLDSTDNTINSAMLVNSDFLSASSLAEGNKRVVLYTTDENGRAVYTKGNVKSAYIDRGEVKIRVQTLNEDGSAGEIKVFSYASIYKAGDLTDDDMNITEAEQSQPENSNNEASSTESSSNTDSSNSEASETENSTNDVVAETANSSNAVANEPGDSDTEINEEELQRESSILNNILGE